MREINFDIERKRQDGQGLEVFSAKKGANGVPIQKHDDTMDSYQSFGASEHNPLLGRTPRLHVGWWSDFTQFLSKGSVLDLGVGIVIGAAFGSIMYPDFLYK